MIRFSGIIVEIMIFAAAISGGIFPSYLIRAIRSENETDASSYMVKACIIFGITLFIVLIIIRS